jgi:hypothetical protein
MNRLTFKDDMFDKYVTSCKECPKFSNCCDSSDCADILADRLGILEDILFAPDGTPRVTLERLRELVEREA